MLIRDEGQDPMAELHGGEITQLDSEHEALRNSFLGWQCRIRQQAVRNAGGRPSSAMCPQVRVDDEPIGRIIVVMNKADPEEITAEFRHIARRTHDPRERYDAAIKLLCAYYYQKAPTFTDELTAVFGLDSTLARHLLSAKRCELDFQQYNQRWRLPCSVYRLEEDDPAYQATYWHNSLFNPAFPGAIQILGFGPDWAGVAAEPPPV
jgi:hypothetical protein